MSRRYVVDFDDLCDATVGTLDTLARIKEKEPDFCCTLFTIPKRTSQATLQRAKGLGSWVALAPHGWRHTRGECLGWSTVEAAFKFAEAKDMGLDAPIFKAPAWLSDEDIYKAAALANIAIADHKDFSPNNPGCPVYRYNDPFYRMRGTSPVHGHLTPVCDNFIDDMLADGRLSFASKSTFLFCHEATK